jgi:hypothetical protein
MTSPERTARAEQACAELAAAGIGADQNLAAQELREREPGRLDMVGGGVRPGIAGPEHDGQRLPVAGFAVVGPGGHGVMTEGLLLL